ncbi:unnamed protein product [Allacma fusca]|uniref:Carboxylesterase type B domain-containing protein n=1 Tax=Allacma fusca TaxID=39272 RepID=A0A8J2KRP6_9HEXA|nr:unnamed protein product [Allacma fusca]
MDCEFFLKGFWRSRHRHSTLSMHNLREAGDFIPMSTLTLKTFSVLLFNLLCGLVPCDPEYRAPDVNPDPGPLTRAHNEDFPSHSFTVQTGSGRVEGYPMKTIEGRDISAFEGIPYGESTGGDNRFKAPVPKKSWDGTWRAHKPGPYCMQYSFYKIFRVIGSEDCLYLNVFTPEVPRDTGDRALPVIIYFHGGSYFMGGGHEYGPSYMLDHDVVLVTINYRLGILGFLSTGDEASPGNYGLKDQALALKWVHENIDKFGGDPNRVTLLGSSAGASSVHLHMISNSTRNYFRNGVSQSATAFNHWGIQPVEVALKWTHKLAKLIKCPTTHSRELMDCVRQTNPDYLTVQTARLFDWLPVPPVLFAPTIEPEGPNAFLTMSPLEAYARNLTSDKPWIATITKEEGFTGIFVTTLLGKLPTLRRHWNKLLRYWLEFDYATDEPLQITDKITKFYIGDQSTWSISNEKLGEMATDRYFLFGLHKALQAHAQVAPASTYAYLFNYTGVHNLANVAGIRSDEWGVGHGEDAFYFFNSSFVYDAFRRDEPDYLISKLVINLVVNFADKGVPVYTKDNGEDMVIWNPVGDPADMKFLQIDEDCHLFQYNFDCIITYESCQPLSSSPVTLFPCEEGDSRLKLILHQNILFHKMIAAFMVNLLCAIVPCDPQFRPPEISELTGPRLGKRFLAPEVTHPTVHLKSGDVQGFLMTSAGGNRIHTFEGIPYGEAPIGKLRFRSPVPKKPWKSILKAIKTGPDCLQFSPTKMFRVYGNEDCLFVNVYSAKLPEKSFEPLLPVIVWIHGGSFYYGSGADYGPTYLLDEKIVLVTLNYRLGILGFMSLGDKHAPGNLGLKDQALAIKWVYDNVHMFGGDPKRITLVGQSAGGASVHLHMLSPMSRPYIHAAVSMSGTAFNNFAVKNITKIKKYTERVASKFRCVSPNLPLESQSEEIVNCLRRQDPVKLVGYQSRLPTWGPFPITLFTPVVESPHDPDSFLTEVPSVAYEKGDVSKIPWMVTITEDEGLYPLLIAYGLWMIPKLRQNFSDLAPQILEYTHMDTAAAERVTGQVMDYYFPNGSIMNASFSKLSEPFSDRIFVNEFHEALLAHSKIAPTYAYIFRYKGKYNVANFMGINTPEWGAGHAEDVFYMFNSSVLYHGFKKSDPERQLSQLMVNLVSNFAARMEPMLTLNDSQPVRIWHPVDPNDVKFLQLDWNIKMIPEPFTDRINFWKVKVILGKVKHPDATKIFETDVDFIIRYSQGPLLLFHFRKKVFE